MADVNARPSRGSQGQRTAQQNGIGLYFGDPGRKLCEGLRQTQGLPPYDFLTRQAFGNGAFGYLRTGVESQKSARSRCPARQKSMARKDQNQGYNRPQKYKVPGIQKVRGAFCDIEELFFRRLRTRIGRKRRPKPHRGAKNGRVTGQQRQACGDPRRPVPSTNKKRRLKNQRRLEQAFGKQRNPVIHPHRLPRQNQGRDVFGTFVGKRGVQQKTGRRRPKRNLKQGGEIRRGPQSAAYRQKQCVQRRPPRFPIRCARCVVKQIGVVLGAEKRQRRQRRNGN